MKAGDTVYNYPTYPRTRGERLEFLCDAIEASIGPIDTDRLSDGAVADALLQFLDLAVTTESQKAALQLFLNDQAPDTLAA